LDVWDNEREVARLKASLSTLTSEVQHLYKLCAEWKEAEDSLRKKWTKIEEFDARRLELECIFSALQLANMVSVQSPDEQALAYSTVYVAHVIHCQLIPYCLPIFILYFHFIDLALADAEKKLKSVTNKLNSITSNFLSEKES
jgi:hypothetical protein